MTTRRTTGDTQLDQLPGRWQGTCKTWFRPEELADESEVTGEFSKVLGGRFLRHTYQGSMQGERRAGEELFAFNTVTQSFEVSWVDDFHMSDAIMFSRGKAIDGGFSVLGPYDVADGQPPWGWRTEYRLIAPDQLLVIAHNRSPEGQEAKAVELDYRRIGP
ncbi:MAG: DUF1579 family protein [Planctomycetota bacterium]